MHLLYYINEISALSRDFLRFRKEFMLTFFKHLLISKRNCPQFIEIHVNIKYNNMASLSGTIYIRKKLI